MSVDSAVGKKHHLKELKEMIQEKGPSEPVGKVLATFCHRHGVPMEQCREYYGELAAKGEVTEKEKPA